MRPPSPSIPILFAFSFCLWACDIFDPGPGSGPVIPTHPVPPVDFNPLPDSAEYVFTKEIRFFYVTGYQCTSEVRRKPFPEPDSGKTRRFIDSNAVRCTFIDFAGDGSGRHETTYFAGTYADTVRFREDSSSLTLEGADRFLNVFLPPGMHPGRPNGIRGGSDFATPTAIFPKTHFPQNDNMVKVDPGYAANCAYAEGDLRLPCKRLIKSDMRYSNETLVFLAKVGFFSLSESSSSAPLGSGSSMSSKVRLLYRVLGGDTLRYPGTIMNP